MKKDLRKEIIKNLEGGDRNKQVATAIKDFCIKNELNTDMRIYFNGICWDFDSDGKMKVIEDIKGSDYFEYADDKSVSVSTEGGLYGVINMDYGYAIHDELYNLLQKFNCYFELGNAWNFTIVWEDDE